MRVRLLYTQCYTLFLTSKLLSHDECFTSTLHFSLSNHLTSTRLIHFSSSDFVYLQSPCHRLHMEFCNRTPQTHLQYHLLYVCVCMLADFDGLLTRFKVWSSNDICETETLSSKCTFISTQETVLLLSFAHIQHTHYTLHITHTHTRPYSVKIVGEVTSWATSGLSYAMMLCNVI